MAKTALVLSGGGSKGAFAVGALKYINAQVQDVSTFDIYCGTSTGALIAPLAACGELALLETVYTTLRQNDLVILGSIGSLVTDVSVHDATPLKGKIGELMTQERFDRLLAKATPINLATVCLQTERLVYWTTQPQPSTKAYDVVPIQSLTDLQRAMLASSCQPVLLQPVEIRPGTTPVRQYVDGGVREPTPLQAAIDQGAETIIAITLNPQLPPADNTAKTKAIQILERTIDMFSEDVGASDYQLAQLYQQGNQYLAAARSSLLAQGVASAAVNVAFAQAPNPFANTALTTLHEIRPQTRLDEGGPGGLTFDPVAMRGMLQKGFEEAKRYFTAVPFAQVL